MIWATVAAATVVAGCSGEGEDAGPGTAPPGDAALAVKDVEGVGQTLVDASGRTLYFADQEAGGSIRCVKACLGFWFPVQGDDSTAGSMPDLGVVRRADTGKDQLTYQGKPLYTFKLDTGPGQHEGHNLEDTFDGTTFTWRAATTTTAATEAPPSSSDNYGY
jgi:predicted lipoprotein with Yx(FWY)xxD motif